MGGEKQRSWMSEGRGRCESKNGVWACKPKRRDFLQNFESRWHLACEKHMKTDARITSGGECDTLQEEVVK